MLITKYILKSMQMSSLAFEKKVVIQTDENVLNGFHLFFFLHSLFWSKKGKRFVHKCNVSRQADNHKKKIPGFPLPMGIQFL